MKPRPAWRPGGAHVRQFKRDWEQTVSFFLRRPLGGGIRCPLMGPLAALSRVVRVPSPSCPLSSQYSQSCGRMVVDVTFTCWP